MAKNSLSQSDLDIRVVRMTDMCIFGAFRHGGPVGTDDGDYGFRCWSRQVALWTRILRRVRWSPADP
jgi:hypothetical protein